MNPAAPPIPAVAADALAGRTVLVTGAHGGLGAEAAKACARAGATVVLLGRKVPKLNRVYDAVKALGPEPALYPVDLAGADPADYAELAARIAGELGGLHGLLHCAAEFKGLAPLEATPPEDFVRSLHVNLTAPWLLTQACLPWLRKAGDSAVVFVTDDPARVGKAYWGSYGLAKQGLVALVRQLSAETDATPVRVSALEPGPMRTDLRARAYADEAQLRVPSPAAYAPACVHLLSPAGAAHRGHVFAPRVPS
ncbi:SDR family NAD(P)-dependent oxidoreductase [Arenimonas sp.]|uniref:SDR family NAD(P)-dependent oxidoreductase n=1 Tax=Arenimonas sp. TaxID=1872635 RepID=UPI002E350690|nr:SDR family NAD(P)-dependent oxidoreductase [Arenimonas sp.]HEX4853024.1 SDR family NAD(P)-dependent oxidoreductase [Arenimonas sp.]